MKGGRFLVRASAIAVVVFNSRNQRVKAERQTKNGLWLRSRQTPESLPRRNRMYLYLGFTFRGGSGSHLFTTGRSRKRGIARCPRNIQGVDEAFGRSLVVSEGTNDLESTDGNEEGEPSDIFERGSEDDPLDEAMWKEIDENAPATWDVVRELLGVNVFTYILAALIVFFLSLNLVFGPGWLGQFLGIEGTGTFTKVSDSLPQSFDLDSSDNLLY